ncbi:MAG TPA: ABC transporter substrate-binding protein [Acetobacteraceae bacterium]|nr:ABC transporter substrate-binding protein [Acetobacteraceae bacterium]
MILSRRALLATAAALPVAARAQTSGEPVMVGVSGPLTGQYAQYGADWKRGFDLAVDEVNASGGIGGRPLAYTFEDTQADPRQAVAIAQKFVSDPRIIIELGDFSSAASMASSPIYQRGKLVQFGFTNSHPDFTKGGDYMWSNAPNQADDMPVLAGYAQKLGLKTFAIASINSDWGRTSKDLFVKAAQANGAMVVAAEAYLPTEQDFRSLLVRLRDAKPDSLILVSYYPDGAELMRQVRSEGINVPVVAAGSVYSPKFLELGGSAVNGVYTTTNFFPGSTQPTVRRFVTAYQAKYHTEPGAYNARAYDAMIVAATLMRQYGATRAGVHDGLSKAKDISSVVFGSITFDPETRRVRNPSVIELVVKNGAFALWDGSPAQAS